MDKDTSISDGFKNIILFVYDVALFVETEDINAWIIDSSASLHMDCNKDWSLSNIMRKLMEHLFN